MIKHPLTVAFWIVLFIVNIVSLVLNLVAHNPVGAVMNFLGAICCLFIVLEEFKA